MKTLCKLISLSLLLTATLTCAVACDDEGTAKETVTETETVNNDWGWPLGDETIVLPEDVFED